MELADGGLKFFHLEQASLAYARSTKPVQYNLPAKAERIAVVGAGLSTV